MHNNKTEMQLLQVFYLPGNGAHDPLHQPFSVRKTRGLSTTGVRIPAKFEKTYDTLQGVKDLLEILDDHGSYNAVRHPLPSFAAGNPMLGRDKQLLRHDLHPG